MSNLVKVEMPLEHRAVIDEETALPRRPVEVVSEAEKRHEKELRPKAQAPEGPFSAAPSNEAALARGIEVDVELLLGFLSAMEELDWKEAESSILGNAKFTYSEAGTDQAKLYIESAGTNLWTMVALGGKPKDERGFVALGSIRRTINVLKMLRHDYRQVTVGVDARGLCIGPYRIPFGGLVDDYPSTPVIRDWEMRIAMPSHYLEEICSRVTPARAQSQVEMGLRGVLLDLEVVMVGEESRLFCTAVATDSIRLHLLHLPQANVETRSGLGPFGLIVPDGFFRYLRAVTNGEWSGIELSEQQVLGRGQDFVVMARGLMKGQTLDGSEWRKFDQDYPGYWLVDRVRLEEILSSAVQAIDDGGVSLRLDAREGTIQVASAESVRSFCETITAKRVGDVSPLVSVVVDARYLLDAVRAAKSGLVRLGFGPHVSEQSRVIVVRGEDERFKALIAPKIG